MKNLTWLLPIILLLAILTNSCKKNGFDTDGALTFSLDTVIFDTVFTTIGSATMQFKVYNPSKDQVKISSVMLAKGPQSKYRINLDGTAGTAFSNIEIPGKDSLFVFVDVTLDPNNLTGAIMVTDSVVFNTNGTQQDVDLVACGWDADFIYPTVFDNPIGPYTFLDCDVIWTSDMPHVIYGWAVVPGGCTLTIEEGTNVYSHQGSGIIVDEGGTLIVNGTPANQVTFASDRLDDFYEDQAGEWNRIWLFSGSKDNVINGALIKNGNVGVHVDSLAANANPNLRISNTVIENMAGASIFSQSATIEAYNCVFGNAGQYSAALTLGGNYNFRHCTFGNYWTGGNRQTPAVVLNNWYEVDGAAYTFDLENAYFGNCIVYGSNQTEVGIDENASSTFNFEFSNCLLRIDADDVDITDPLEFHGTVWNDDPEFINPTESNFELNVLSPAEDAGAMSIVNTMPELQFDVLGNSRVSDAGPDLGAYERQE